MYTKRKNKLMEITIFILSGCVLTLSVFNMFFDNTKAFYVSIAYIIVALEAISIWISNIYQRSVEIEVLNGKSIDDIIDIMHPDKTKSSIQESRDELRYGLKILLAISVALVLYWSIISFNIWNFIISICVLCVAFVFADYIPHAVYYAKRYDFNFGNNEMNASSIRGLARIYLEEYKKSEHFKRNSDFYKTIDDYSADNNCGEQDKCIKSILFIKVDSIKNPIIVVGIVLLFFNMILAVPNIINITLYQMFENIKIDSTTAQSVIVLIINIFFSLLSYHSSITYYKKCDEIKKIFEAYCSDNFNDRIEKYNEIKNS